MAASLSVYMDFLTIYVKFRLNKVLFSWSRGRILYNFDWFGQHMTFSHFRNILENGKNREKVVSEVQKKMEVMRDGRINRNGAVVSMGAHPKIWLNHLSHVSTHSTLKNPLQVLKGGLSELKETVKEQEEFGLWQISMIRVYGHSYRL